MFIPQGNYGRLPIGWSVVGVADFNGDGHPDYLLFNEAVRATVIWYMNNNVPTSGNYGPAVPTGWSVVAVADFNGDGIRIICCLTRHARHSDLVYEQQCSYLGNDGPAVRTGWSVAGAADFDGNGSTDYGWKSEHSPDNDLGDGRECSRWHSDGPTLPSGWTWLRLERPLAALQKVSFPAG